MTLLKKFFGKRICAAVSGGVDSVVLLHYLKSEEARYGYTLSAVHCEHGIRGEESIEDMRFVEAFCKALSVPLYCFSGDCPARARQEKASLETAARNFRRECFAALIETGKADFIATAHHSGDEAETVLFRIARGSSLTGAGGMATESGYMLRPMLRWTKSEIIAYAQENGLEHREDKTNADIEITRNKIRLEVLPRLEEAVHGAAENVTRFALRAAEDDALLYEYAQELLDQTDEGYLVSFSEKRPLFCRACLSAMKALGMEKDYTEAHLFDAFMLQSSERNAKIDLPQDIEAVKTEKGILFRIKKEPITVQNPTEKAFHENGFDGGRYEVKISKVPQEENGQWRVLRADGAKIPQTAVFRFRKEGDEIARFGGGRKSLKKFFNEKKIPVEEREYLPMIAEKDGAEVYAVCGVEISEKIKVDENTRCVLYISIQKKEKN